MGNTRCTIINVSGLVQGVGFRYFTFLQARKLHLSGTVRNLDDGQVEIIACGTTQQIEQLIHWLEQDGPPSAKIKGFIHQPYVTKEFNGFKILA